MKFSEIVTQTFAWLQREGRVSYRALRLEFGLNEDVLDALKEELIEVKEAAVDKDGKMLVWTGASVGQEPENRGTGESENNRTIASDARLQTLDPRRDAAERRQLTVLFCDLVDSTALSARLDPEELRDVVRAYQQMCAEIITRYEGHIAQYLGDGLLVYFGYPIAHEDDAQRAVHSGLAIVEALQQAPLLQRHGVQVRIGIHTGLVVVGEIGGGAKREQLALGDTPNIAARLQGLAQPNTVVMGEATQRLVAGLFDCDDLGQHPLKGLSAPMQVYQVRGESGVRSRLEVASRRGLTPLIGREHEVQLLLDRWEQVKTGAGQVVLLSGEPGIGKSRLVHKMKEQGAAEGAPCIEFRCAPFSQNTAFAPVLDHLQRLLQFQREDALTVKLAKLQHTLSRYHFPQADTLPLLAALLSLPQPEGVPPLTFSPQKQKQRTEEAMVAWLIEEAERQAVVTVWEDLHWAGPSTLELLTLLLDQVPTTRLFVMLTARPEFQAPWPSRGYVMTLTLNRLPRTQVELMVQQVTGEKVIPAEMLQQIVAKTDGVPLFVEELTKMVLETIREQAAGVEEQESKVVGTPSGWSSLQLGVPSTLQDALMARLDRLGPAKEIAQLGATLGREFSYELTHAVSPLDEATLQHGLKQLVEVELVYQRGLAPQAHYTFKHALIQDTAYQSLLKSTRQQYHHQIAQVLEERFTETVETQPELVAHHYTEADLVAQALPYWQQAGQKAVERSANIEAISHFTKGLKLLRILPETPERIQHELTLQIARGASLMATKGWVAPEVEKTYARARELCQQAGEIPQLFPVLFGLQAFYFVRAEHKIAHDIVRQLPSLAQSAQDPAFLLGAHTLLGTILFVLGEFAPAREHLEQGAVPYDSQQPRPLWMWIDFGVADSSYTALVLWLPGYPDQALKRTHEALIVAQKLSHPFSLAHTIGFAAMLHHLRQEGQAAQEQAEAVMTLSTEQGFPYWLAFGTIVRGGAMAEQGQEEERIIQMYQGLIAYRAMGAGLWQPYFLALLAEAHGKVGQIEQGLAALAVALAVVDKTWERFYEAELYRIKGTLTLQSQVESYKSKVEKAEECFLRAIDIAQRQQAKSLELRATMSLSRLWQQQGKQKEAHKMLSDIYNWFTEGFDTKDLQEAKALLESLA